MLCVFILALLSTKMAETKQAVDLPAVLLD